MSAPPPNTPTMSDLPLCPFNSKLQNQAARAREYERPPAVCLVTGGTGFVGQRLVEMLVERGAERVISFDIVPPHDNCWKHEAIEYVVGDISDTDMVDKVCEGVDCVWHIAAAVGPFHPQELYVNCPVVFLPSGLFLPRDRLSLAAIAQCSSEPNTRPFNYSNSEFLGG